MPLLQSNADGELSATIILEWLVERHPGSFGRSHLRIPQRRIRDQGTLQGSVIEMYFQQYQPPGADRPVQLRNWSGGGA